MAHRIPPRQRRVDPLGPIFDREPYQGLNRRRRSIDAVRRAVGASLAAATLVGLAADAAFAGAKAEAPALSDLPGYACRPVFQQDGHANSSGTAFPLRAPAFSERPVLLTAHHLFGLATRAGGGMAWQDAPTRIRGAACRALDGGARWTTGPAVAIAGVHAFWRLPEVDDIAALPITGGPERMLTLAPAEAAPGDLVWLVAQTADPLHPKDDLHPARVVANRGYLAFVYQEPGLMLANTSGGPIVDAAGRVVGVNVAVGHLPNGAAFGAADNLATIQTALLATRGH